MVQGTPTNPVSMSNSSALPDSGIDLGRIRCVVDVGENSIEIDPYVADFFFEPIFLSGMYPDMTCTAQVLGLEEQSSSLIKVDIVSKRRGQRYDALRITSEELFSKPNRFSVVFGFDSERLQAPLQLEAEIDVRHAGSPIVARVFSGLPSSFPGSVSSDLSGLSRSVSSERAMTFWDWPLDNARLEVKADEKWLSDFGSIEVAFSLGEVHKSIRLSEKFTEVDFSAIMQLPLPRDGFPNAPYHSCAYMLLRLGGVQSEFPIVSHLVETRRNRRRKLGKIGDLDDPDGWPFFLWRGIHFKDQPEGDKFLIQKGKLWEGFNYLDSEIPETIKRVQHDRYTSSIPTRAWFDYKGSEFIVNWFHLDDYGWKVYFEED